ncbi:MAG: HAMP domain-containing sensor histidine kinase [Planctomycetota bacterium]
MSENRTVSESLQNELENLRQENTGLKKQLERTQRMTALGELVGTTTHEFNNVLMTIINYAKMGMRHDDKDTRDKAFDKINTAGLRASKITNAVLGMARNRSEHFEMTDLSQIIEESMVLLEREMMKYRISVDKQIDDVPEVSAIGNQIQQVLMNILINARQAMVDGGQLIIKLKENVEAKTVELAIRDYGPGIPQDKLRKIFQPYYTTKSGPDATGKGGMGVGLATCKNIIEAHGGKIRVESTVGKGTCFTLILPQEKQKSPIPMAQGVAGALSHMNANTVIPNG